MVNRERYESYGQHSPNYLADEPRRKKALRTKARNKSDEGYVIGSLANLRRRQETSGEDPQAPESVGDLMSPRTIGREGPPSSEEEFSRRKARNLDFLKSREAQAALLQFGVSLLSSAGNGGGLGGNIGDALASAAGAPGRLHEADVELQTEDRKARIEERKMSLEESKLDLDTLKFLQGDTPAPLELERTIAAQRKAEAAGDWKAAKLFQARAFQLSQEYSIQTGQYIDVGGGGNEGISDGGPSLKNFAGGKADLEIKAAEQASAVEWGNQVQKGRSVTEAVDTINDIIGKNVAPHFMITGLGNLVKYLPVSSDAARVAAQLEVIGSNVSFDQLQEMRKASPTGAALGPVSDKEGSLLRSTLAALDQTVSLEDLQKSMRIIKFLFDPASLGERMDWDRQVADGSMTREEALNRFDDMYSKAVHPPEDLEGPTMTLDEPPAYLDDEMKALWSTATAKERRALLSDEDKAEFDRQQQLLGK